MVEKIMTLHPQQGKQGVNIDKARYDQVRVAILDVLRNAGEVTFTRLVEAVNEMLAGRFDGSISWYVTTVKLDMEARGEIERILGSSPQRLRLVR